MKNVTVNISEFGEVQIDVNGVHGKSCVDLTRKIEEALGKTTERQATTDMHKQAKGTIGARQSN